MFYSGRARGEKLKVCSYILVFAFKQDYRNRLDAYPKREDKNTFAILHNVCGCPRHQAPVYLRTASELHNGALPY